MVFDTKAAAIKEARNYLDLGNGFISSPLNFFIVFRWENGIIHGKWDYIGFDESPDMNSFLSRFPTIKTYFIFDINKQREMFPPKLASIPPVASLRSTTEQQLYMQQIREEKQRNGKGQRKQGF